MHYSGVNEMKASQRSTGMLNSFKAPDRFEDKADIYLKNGTMLNVYTGELITANVAVKGQKIYYVGPLLEHIGDSTTILDVENKVLVPGYIEPHFHPWDIYSPLSAGEHACRLGTTTVVCDNLIFYILMGPDLFVDFMTAFSEMPIKYYWSCRAVAQSPMKGEAELFSIENIDRLLRHPLVQSVGEITRWHDILRNDARIIEIIHLAKKYRKRVDGHTAGAKYDKLNIISRAGVESCHESINGQEVLDRLRLGFYVMLRQSSLRQDLKILIHSLLENQLLVDRVMLTTDGSTPLFYEEEGVTDSLVRIAIGEGVDPILAYRMVTLHPAVYFGLDSDVGGIAPGRYADILVLENLLNPTPEKVISRGRIVAENQALVEPFPQIEWGSFFPEKTFDGHGLRLKPHVFSVPCTENTIEFPTIKLISSVITRTDWVEFKTKHGFLDLEEKRNCCFLSLLHKGGRWVSNGIIQDFAENVQGLASSYNTAAEILVIGRKTEAMAAAVNRVMELGGGIVAVEDGKVIYELPLPLGGMMSKLPMKELARHERDLARLLSERGYRYHDPLYTILFLPNDFLPDVRINYSGVVEIKKNEILWPRRDLDQDHGL